MAAERPVRWSHARARLLKECPRAFYLRYLTQGPERVHLRALGQLGTLPMLAGTAVDLVAAHAVARPEKADLPHYGARLFRRMVEVGESAGAGAARDGLLPPRLDAPFRPLTHAFFGIDVGEDYVHRLEHRVADGLRRLEASDTLRRLRARKPSEVRLSTLVGPLPSVRVEGAELLTAPDVLERRDSVLVVDFKSGSASPAARAAAASQLRLYALAEWHRSGIAAARVETQAVWLAEDGEDAPSPLCLEGVAEALADLRDGLQDLSKRTGTADGGAFDIASFEARPAAGRCTWCCFRPLCSEGEEATDHLRPQTTFDTVQGTNNVKQ